MVEGRLSKTKMQ
jgi:hypothetical protein